MAQLYSPKQVREAYEVGKVKGYRKAIEAAKEWLKDNAHDYSFSNEGCDALLTDFERNMNKLWRKRNEQKEERG